MTLLFNVLVTASPKELAGDVGSLRGTTNNLAAAVGTAVAGALLVGLLSAAVLRGIAENPMLPPEVQSQVDLDNITFVSNDRLEERAGGHDRNAGAGRRSGARQHRGAAARAEDRAADHGGPGVAGIIPAGRLPNYRPGEMPAD